MAERLFDASVRAEIATEAVEPLSKIFGRN